MSLPKRVQADLQAAEALEAKMLEQRSQAPATVQSVASLSVPPAANEPPSEPQQAPPVEPAPAPVAPKDDFEHKYKVLQGMYAADVTRLNKQSGAVTSQLQTLAAELQALKAVREAPTQPAPADPKDLENFGADLIEMVQRYAERKAAETESRIAALERQVLGVTQSTAATLEQSFYATVDQLVPDWRELNENPRWLAWLGEVDPVYGAPRQAALNAAHQKMDAPRVAAVFNAYKATVPAPPPQSSLANQVAPSGAASVVPASTAPKPVFSEKSITDFYNDLGRGKYAGRQAEADAIEAQINAAVAEGRVR
jgi:hypothetical protein